MRRRQTKIDQSINVFTHRKRAKVLVRSPSPPLHRQESVSRTCMAHQCLRPFSRERSLFIRNHLGYQMANDKEIGGWFLFFVAHLKLLKPHQRMTHQVAPNLLLASKQKIHFSIRTEGAYTGTQPSISCQEEVGTTLWVTLQQYNKKSYSTPHIPGLISLVWSCNLDCFKLGKI